MVELALRRMIGMSLVDAMRELSVDKQIVPRPTEEIRSDANVVFTERGRFAEDFSSG